MKKITQISECLITWTQTYALAIICYLPFLFYFLWGNHDWGWIKDNTPLWSGVFEGRFSQFILPSLLFSGQILPLFSIASGLAFLTLTAILFIKIYELPIKPFLVVLLSAVTVTSPYTLSWLYFAFLTLSCLSWTFIILSAFLILQKKITPLISIPVATILITLAIGGYPPVVNMIGTILTLLIITDLCLNHLTFFQLIRKYIPHVISIITSILVFLLIQYFLKKAGLQKDTYNTAGINFSNFPQQLKDGLLESITQFTYATSFINPLYKCLTSILSIAALYSLFRNLKKSILNITMFLCLLTALLLSSVATSLIAQNTLYVLQEARIKFFTLPYITLFSAIILLQSNRKILTNFVFFIALLLLFSNLVTNSYAAKVWLFGFKTEAAFSERFITRLEQQPDFSPAHHKYTFIQSGTLSFRSKYYTHIRNTHEDSYTLSAPYIPWHLPYKAYTFYYPYIFINQDFDVYWQTVNPDFIEMTPSLKKYLIQKAAPWPQKNAIYYSPNLIILTQSASGKRSGANWYHNFYPGYPH